MTTPIDDPNSIPPGFTAIENDNLSQMTGDMEYNFMYNDEYDSNTDQSVYSEIIFNRPDRHSGGKNGIQHVSLLSKTGKFYIHRPVPHKLREKIGRSFVKVPVYETSLTPNHRIKNAITGFSTPHRVGTNAESLYFKVCWAVGTDGRREPINLFFETPYDFEKHFMETLSDDVKTDWNNRNMVAEKAYYVAKEEKNNSQTQFTVVH